MCQPFCCTRETQDGRGNARSMIDIALAATSSDCSVQPIAKDNIDQWHMHLMFSERAVTELTQSENMSHAVAVASRTGAAP